MPADASASNMYVTSASLGSLSGFSIGSSGSLTPIVCGEGCDTESSISEPYGIAASPNGRFVYVANSNGNGKVAGGTIEPFAVGSDGGLSPMPCPTECKTGSFPLGIAVAPDGHFLYVVNVDSPSLSIFSIAENGSLSPVTCNDCGLPSGSNPEEVVISPGRPVSLRREREMKHIAVFSIAADGTLSKVSCTSACETQLGPLGMVISPDGRFLYVAVTELEIEVFEIRAGGVLARVLCSTCHTEARPRALAIGPNGRFLYATNNNSGESSIPAFEIRPDGSLLPIHGSAKRTARPRKPNFPWGSP